MSLLLAVSASFDDRDMRVATMFDQVGLKVNSASVVL